MSKLDGPSPVKKKYIFHAGPSVLLLAWVLQKPVNSNILSVHNGSASQGSRRTGAGIAFS